MANRITTFAESHTVVIFARKLNGKLNKKNFKALSNLIMKRKCSTITKLGFFMVSLCLLASPEELSLS